MPTSKRLPNPLILFLLFYLLALVGLGSYLFWPEPDQAPLRVTRADLAPSGDRILLEGEGFSGSTQVSLALDVSNRRFLRHTVPTWGPGGDLVRVGRLAYATKRDMGLLILDLAEPERPRVVGTLRLPGRARTLTVEAGVAYVACDREGVVLVDVSQPSAPRLMATLPELSKTQGLAVRNGRLYTTLYGDNIAPALAVVDVSDPGRPKILGRWPLPGQPLGVALGHDGLLIAAGKEGLLEVELGAGPPRIRSRLPLPGSALAVRVVGEHAYVASTYGGLAVVELTTGAPRLLAHLPLPGNTSRLTVEEGRLYISAAAGGGKVFDIQDPGQPRLLGDFSAPRGSWGITALGTTVYLNTLYNGIQVFNLAAPTPWQGVAQIDLGERIRTVNAENGRLIVSTSNGNLHVLEGLGGDPLRLVTTLALKGAGYSLQIHQGHAYARIDNLGLEVVDIRNSQAPFMAGFYSVDGKNQVPPKGRNSLAVAGDQGILIDGALRLWRFGTTKPGAGELLPGPELTEQASKVVMADNRLFIASREGGRIRPVELQSGEAYKTYPQYQLPAQQINQLELLGQVVVAACGLEGLLIVDFTAPAAPRLLAALSLPIAANILHLVGTTAYVGDAEGGFLEVDLSDPARPRIGALLADAPGMEDFAVAGKHAFLATGSAGLLVVPLPQVLQPLTRSGQAMTLALPPIDTPGHYTLRITDGSQTVVLPGALALGAR
ncbi:MAG: hypothetical protein ACYDAI_11270 [Trichloromonadaceae bacterium]